MESRRTPTADEQARAVLPSESLAISYVDDPRVLREQAAEDYSNHVVPPSVRVGRWKLTMSTWSLLSALNWIFYGALAATLVGTKAALLGIALSVVAYAVINVFMADYGTRFGLGSFLLSRRMFGVRGAWVTAILVAAGTTYFAVFESSVLAVAAHSYVGGPGLKVWYLIVILAILPLTLGSVQTWMAKVNSALLPIYVIGVIAAVVSAAVKSSANTAWLDAPGIGGVPGVPGFVQAFCLYMGVWLLMPVTVDFAIFGRRRDLRFHQNVTFGWVFYVWLFMANGVAGIFLVHTMLPDDPAAEVGVVQAILKSLGGFGLILLIATQARINTTNYYLASSNWRRVFSGLVGVHLPRLAWVGIVAAVVYLLMLTDVFSYLQEALLYQAVLMVGWVGVVLTHFALHRSDRLNGPEFRATRLPAITLGFGAWLVSAAIGAVFVASPDRFPRLSVIAPLVTLVVSVVSYALLTRVVRDRPNTTPDIRDSVPDPWAARVRCDGCDRSYVAVEMDHTPDGHVQCVECADHGRRIPSK